MNIIKKVSATVLVLIMALSVCACHPKDEVAVKVGDYEFTSAYYMCALIEADLSAKQKIDDEADENADTSADDYYYKQKIDGKKFVDYVKEQALLSLKKVAVLKAECKKAKVTVSSEDESNVKMYAQYYWSSYGYNQLYEPNGVSQDTYIKYTTDSYYSNKYFDSIYGEDGTTPIASEDISEFMTENYRLANVLDADFSSIEDSEKETKTAQINDYYEKLKAGTYTFAQVYNEYNGTTDESTTDTTDAEDGSAPKDSHATVIGNDKTNYSNDLFDTVSAMAMGEIKLITKDNDAGYQIVIKKDITEDSYYLKNLDSEIRHNLKDDEFNEKVDSLVKKAKVTENKSATKRFKVEKIVYPETDSSTTTA